MGNQSLLQGIFLTQELNWGPPRCRQTLYHLSHQGSLVLPPPTREVQWEEVILVVSDSREGQHVFVDVQHDGRALNVELGKSRIGYNLCYPGHTSFFLRA